jgi:hypothetical protein
MKAVWDNIKATIMKTFVIGVVLAGFVAALPAKADSVVYTGSYGPTTTDIIDQMIALQGFNTALGTLNSVTIDFTGTGQFKQYYENLDGPGSITYTTDSLAVNLLMPDNSTQLFNFNQNEVHTYTFTAYDGTLDYGGTSGGTYYYPVNMVGSTSLTSPANLTQFTNPGLLDLYLNASGAVGWTISGGNNNVGAGLTAGADISVTYDYTPVPEPSSLGLLIGGLGLLIGIHRTRRGNLPIKP